MRRGVLVVVVCLWMSLPAVAQQGAPPDNSKYEVMLLERTHKFLSQLCADVTRQAEEAEKRAMKLEEENRKLKAQTATGKEKAHDEPVAPQQ